MKKFFLTVSLIFGLNPVIQAMEKGAPKQLITARKSLSALIKEGSLNNLNNAANIMLASARLYDMLKEIYPLVPKLKKYQSVRIVDDGKSFIRQYGVATENCVVELARKTKFGDEYGFYTNNPDAKAFMLQIAPILRNPGNALNTENISFLENILKSNEYDNEIKILSELGLHALYAAKFFAIYHAAPHIIKQLSLLQCSYKNILPLIMSKGLRCKSNVINFINDLEFPKQIFALAVELDYCYRNAGDDYANSIIITKQFKNLTKKIVALSKEFECYKDEYDNLYKILIKMLVLEGRKKKVAVHSYKARNSHLFDVVSIRSEIKYICDDNLLPAELWEVKQDTVIEKETSIPKQIKKEKKVNKLDQNYKKQKVVNQKKSIERKPRTIKPKMQLKNNSVVVNSNLHATKYSPRVMRWFDKETTDQDVISADTSSVLYHSFPLCLDKYIFSLGIQTPWQNQTNQDQIDTNYSLGGEIIYSNGEGKQVVFTCCKDSTDICYHRGFSIKEKNALFDEYFSKSSWEVNFPQLGEHKNDAIKYKYQEKDEYNNYIISENEFCIRARDNKNNVTIILYKPYKNSN